MCIRDRHTGSRSERNATARIAAMPVAFSFIRTVTVGFGIEPNLLTLRSKPRRKGNGADASARGLMCTRHKHRR